MSTRLNVLMEGKISSGSSVFLLLGLISFDMSYFVQIQHMGLTDERLTIFVLSWNWMVFSEILPLQDSIIKSFQFLKFSNNFWVYYKTFQIAMLAHNNGFLNLLHAELPWGNCCSHLVGPPAAQRYGMRSPFGSKRWNVERKSIVLGREPSNQANLLVSPLLDRFPARRRSPPMSRSNSKKNILVQDAVKIVLNWCGFKNAY